MEDVDNISDLIAAHSLGKTPSKGKRKPTERGELLKYFSQKTGKSIGELCGRFIPPGLTVQDFYYMKSNADAYEREGKGPWSVAFFGSLKHNAAI